MVFRCSGLDSSIYAILCYSFNVFSIAYCHVELIKMIHVVYVGQWVLDYILLYYQSLFEMCLYIPVEQLETDTVQTGQLLFESWNLTFNSGCWYIGKIRAQFKMFSKSIKGDTCRVILLGTGDHFSRENIKCARSKKMSLFSCNVHYHSN